jgi:hypothetical protein
MDNAYTHTYTHIVLIYIYGGICMYVKKNKTRHAVKSEGWLFEK